MQEGEWYYCNVCSLGEAAILPHHRTTLHTPQPPALCPVTVPRCRAELPPQPLAACCRPAPTRLWGISGRFHPLFAWAACSAGSMGSVRAPGTCPHPHATSRAGADAAGQPGHPPPPLVLDELPFPVLASPRGHCACLVQVCTELPDDFHSSCTTVGTSRPCPPTARDLLPSSCWSKEQPSLLL